MTRRHITARLLAGSSYELRQAIDTRTVGRSHLEHQTLSAIEALIDDVTTGGTTWHISRGIEAMHYLDWTWRKARQLSDGPAAP